MTLVVYQPHLPAPMLTLSDTHLHKLYGALTPTVQSGPALSLAPLLNANANLHLPPPLLDQPLPTIQSSTATLQSVEHAAITAFHLLAMELRFVVVVKALVIGSVPTSSASKIKTVVVQAATTCTRVSGTRMWSPKGAW